LVYVVEVIFEISLKDTSLFFISIKPKEARSFLGNAGVIQMAVKNLL